MYKYILTFFAVCALAAEYPGQLPQAKITYRANETIKSEDANHVGRTINALAAKVGIDNTQLYGNRYTNTIDYKVWYLSGLSTSNRLLINQILAGSGGSTNLNVTNQLTGWLYIISPVLTQKTGGLRLFYTADEYAASNTAFELYSMIDNVVDPGLSASYTNLITSAEFVDRMKFYGYRNDESAGQERNPENLVMALYAGLQSGGETNYNLKPYGQYLKTSGGIYMGRPLLIDNGYFADNITNNYFSISEQSKYYDPLSIRPNDTNAVLELYSSLDPTNNFGSFLVFRPIPKGLNNITPMGFDFLDPDGFPIMTVRGIHRPYGLTNTFNQFWVIDFHQKKVTGVPEPALGELNDAVNVSYLNKEFDRKLRQIHSDVLGIKTNQTKTYGQYLRHYDKNYLNVMDRVFINPMVGVSDTNLANFLPMSTFSVENQIDAMIFSYDGTMTNLAGTNATANFTFTGCVVDPLNIIPNLYGVQTRNEYTGICNIPAGETKAVINVDNSQGIYSNIVLTNTCVIVCPYRAENRLFTYWYQYINTNSFSINMDSPSTQDTEFKWLVPHVLTSSFNSVSYAKDDVQMPSGFITIPAGEVITTNNYTLLNVDGNYDNYAVLLTPRTVLTNLVSWYQVRDINSTNLAQIRVALDAPQTYDISFNYFRIKKHTQR